MEVAEMADCSVGSLASSTYKYLQVDKLGYLADEISKKMLKVWSSSSLLLVVKWNRTEIN